MEGAEGSISEDGLRGLLLGLAMGDSFERARGSLPSSGTIEVGVGTQLAAFTADSLIRMMASTDTLTSDGVAQELWKGLGRWGAQQGLLPKSDGPPVVTPDGWVSSVPALAERRGSAPATVAAIKRGRAGTVERPINVNRPGTTVVLRTLPTAVLAHLLPYLGDYDSPDPEFASFAALTHGDGSALYASVATASIASRCLHGLDVSDAVGASGFCSMGSLLGAARDLAVDKPRHPKALVRWMRDHSESAMMGGVYSAISFPDPGEILDALHFAYRMPGGRGSAAVATALLGAVHGVHALPVEVVSRLELTWVLDNLARDLSACLRGDVLSWSHDRYPSDEQ